MNALEFIREKNRMCKSFGDSKGCMSCPVYKEGNRCAAILWKEEIIPIVEKWSKENPRKTRQSVFLGQYPNAAIRNDGFVNIDPCDIDKKVRKSAGCGGVGCINCRREFWMQEVE